jgi:hypothetical protein
MDLPPEFASHGQARLEEYSLERTSRKALDAVEAALG